MGVSQILMVIALGTGALIFVWTAPVFGPWAVILAVLATVGVVLGGTYGGALLLASLMQSWVGLLVLAVLMFGIRRLL